MWKGILIVLALILGADAVYLLMTDTETEATHPSPPAPVLSASRAEAPASKPTPKTVRDTRLAENVTQQPHPVPRPRYLGGLKNMQCFEGKKLPLEAAFSHSGSGKILYYSDGSELEGDEFVCESAGDYTLSAKLVENGRIVASSPEFKVHVERLPAEIEELQESQHVHF